MTRTLTPAQAQSRLDAMEPPEDAPPVPEEVVWRAMDGLLNDIDLILAYELEHGAEEGGPERETFVTWLGPRLDAEIDRLLRQDREEEEKNREPY